MEEQMKRFIKSQLTPELAATFLKDMVDRVTKQILRESYISVVFDSPLGNESKHRLKSMGYELVKWVGHCGCRGETKVWVPKTENIATFIEKLKSSDLVDRYTAITVNGGNND